MDKQQQPEKFPKQEAPEKNTDNAFVRVGNDGSPQMPGTAAGVPDEKRDAEPENTDLINP